MKKTTVIKTTVKVLAMLIGWLMVSNQLMADVNVLIIGSSRDSGEMHNSSVWWNAHSYNLTHSKLNEAPTARNFLARSLWAQIDKEYLALSPMRDKAKLKGEFAITSVRL